MTFGNWDSSIHNHHDQIKRIATMQKIKSSSVSINFDSMTAEIEGRDGIYNVSLDCCTCFDFDSRQLPCKHIYKLAFECGIFNPIPKLNRKAAKLFKDNTPYEIERFKNDYLSGAISIDKFNKIVTALQSK